MSFEKVKEEENLPEKLSSSFSELRELSRLKYLSHRQEQQLRLLSQEVEDEERVFLARGVHLSRQEKLRLEEKRRILAIAREMVHDLDSARVSEAARGYQMLEFNEGSGFISRDSFEQLKSQKQDKLDDLDWEQSLISKAVPKAPARPIKSDAFSLIIENQVQFVKEDLLRGLNTTSPPKPQSIQPERSFQDVRKSLPVYNFRSQFLKAVETHQILIVVGETGSGKTTQLPQYLLEEGWASSAKIGCTQPRRVAAMSVAQRVSEERGTRLGGEVGYSIRFEDCTSDETKIKYMTDGMLLREFLTEPDLSGYSVMMIDEAHERSLHTDILLALLKDVAKYRSDLRLIIASATVNAIKFSNYFNDAPVFKIPGRRFPVSIHYTKQPEANYIDACTVSVLQIHFTEDEGDILVFLTGQSEIETVAESLERKMEHCKDTAMQLVICPIYANLPSELQSEIFKPTPKGARKVVLATNIAETSLTIEGIKFVIDPGFCKQNSYNPRSGMESLVVVPISKASAEQRAGRAGRTSPGKCFRLYTAYAYEHELENEMVPELQRTNLGNVVLLLKSLGIDDLIHFDFLDPPPAEMLIRALELLYALGALNDLGQLTKLGRMMAEFPMDPMMSKMLLQSNQYGVTDQILSIASMLSVNASVFYRPKSKTLHADKAHKHFHSKFGDHMTLLNVYNAWVESDYSVNWCFENFVQSKSMRRAKDVRKQLEALLERVQVPVVSNPNDHEAIRKSICSGFFYHTARLDRGGGYRTTKQNQDVYLHPSSCLFEDAPAWIVYNELVLTSKKYVRVVSVIEPNWLVEIAPHFYTPKDVGTQDMRKMPKLMKPKK